MVRPILYVILMLLLLGLPATEALPQEKSITVAFDQATGRWQFFDGGDAFLSRGVVGIRYAGDGSRNPKEQNYGQKLQPLGVDKPAFVKQVSQRLREWGFNTVGPWSDEDVCLQSGLYYTVNLQGGYHAIKSGKLLGKFPDVFDPHFQATVEARVSEISRQHRGQPNLLGYFTDNELQWGPDLLDRFLRLPDGAPGKEAALKFLRQHLGASASPGAAAAKSPALRTAFVEIVAEQYFKTFQESLARHAPGRLNLGCRFAGFKRYDPAVARVAGRFVDVISLNHYPRSFEAIKEKIRDLHAVSGKPILIGEFSVRGKDSGLPNTKGGGVLVATQRDRGQWYRRFVCDLLGEPYIVGYHWFRWVDEPKEGRFDGENSNVGLVDINNRPYKDFIDQVKLQDQPCQ